MSLFILSKLKKEVPASQYVVIVETFLMSRLGFYGIAKVDGMKPRRRTTFVILGLSKDLVEVGLSPVIRRGRLNFLATVAFFYFSSEVTGLTIYQTS